MYQLTSAIAKPVNGNGHWKSVDIGDVAMNVLFSTYSGIWAILSNVFLSAPVALDLELIRAEHGGKSITFNQVLASLGTQSLPTTDTIPHIKPRYAKYQDAIKAGYHVQPIHPSFAPDASVPERDKTWLHVTRPETDYSLFYKCCLMNVNGYFHLTDAGPNGVYVKDGMKSAWISGENQIGFLSFANLGFIQQVPITKDMVYKQNPDQVFQERAYINVGQDLSKKKVFLVLGGYLHSVGHGWAVSQVGDSHVMVDFNKLPLLERYYESSRYLDLSSLKLSKTSANDYQIALSELYSDEALLAYMTLSQSFFVIVDNNDMFVEHVPLAKSSIPNQFIAEEYPLYPLTTGVGRIANYWTKTDAGKFALYCTDNFRPRPLYMTSKLDITPSVSDQRIPAQPYDLPDAFFLKIGSDLS